MLSKGNRREWLTMVRVRSIKRGVVCNRPHSDKDGGRGVVWGHTFGLCGLLVVLYAAGLTQDLTRPWTGFHDWLGAFHSQFARNLLRYPLDVHHGMPVMAMGEAIPPPEERSIYATHPPGLTWLIALSFWVLGEAEWAARLVPIVCSLGTLPLFVCLVARKWGRETGGLAGLVYAVLPMAVYFGRLVDHEAVCLFGMFVVLNSWQVVVDRVSSARARRWAFAGTVVALVGISWVDWAGVLFAGLFCVHVGWQRRCGLLSNRAVVVVWLSTFLACASMLIFLVYFGLGGQWGDLLEIFRGRSGSLEYGQLRNMAWDHTIRGFTWPVLVLVTIGACVAIRQWRQQYIASRKVQAESGLQEQNSSLWVLASTGVLWVAVFWRQYEIHNYWVFYLTPMMALSSAMALVWIRNRLQSVGGQFAGGCLFLAIGVVVGFCLRNTNNYFTWSWGDASIRAWQEVHRRTQPGDRVLLTRDPRDVNRHGSYVFRNIIPPTKAYYMDRAWGIEDTVDGVFRRASDYSMFIMTIEEAEAAPKAVEALSERFPMNWVETRVLFDLREDKAVVSESG